MVVRPLGAALCAVAALLAAARPAQAWIETHVVGDEARVEIERSGKALVEHRIRITTKGSEKLRSFDLVGVDADAAPAEGSYVVPEREALAISLESAVPLRTALDLPKPRAADGSGARDAPPPRLRLELDADRGLERGGYVLVVRYRTDLLARGGIARDGAMAEVSWTGPIFEDGFDGARTTFALPASPTPPRAIELPEMGTPGDEASAAPAFLSQVHRGEEQDEIELVRAFAPKREAIAWTVRVDPRAFADLPRPELRQGAAPAPAGLGLPADPRARRWWLGGAGGLFALYALCVLLKGREVARRARAARAEVPPFVPLPLVLRAALAAAALVGGLGLQLRTDRALLGSALVVGAAALAAHGAARHAAAARPGGASAALRGPGRWLSVTEAETLRGIPRPAGAWLDVSTRAGKALCLVALALLAAGVAWLCRSEPERALLLGLDSAALLAVFGTGRTNGLPADLAVEPGRLLAKVAARIRKMAPAAGLRLVPRIRLPDGETDPDELRLLVVPRLPRRGFSAIEVGVTYALGLGARVAMPEILLRAVAGSECDRAAAALSRYARISPGRKPEERVLAFSPRLPTAKMTAQIAVALAAAVTDHAAAGAAPRTADKPAATGPAKAA
ncbi:MAG: hypothetical protein HY744_05995 [Deltaproteobacteria bacterium]|nr:hypothetical protein [Deltaproteobacteria bacterium]